MCEGRDRFRFDDKDGSGSFFCNQCGSGKGIDLAMKFNGWDFKTAAREVEKLAGSAPVFEVRKGPAPQTVKDQMQGIWRSSLPLDMVAGARLWWQARTGQALDCKDVRAVEHLALPYDRDRTFPAMVAKVRDKDGNWVNLHRTFLDGRGGKAPIEQARWVMELGLPKGCAVRLADPGEHMGIAEGIETARAATILTGVPCWAALTAGNMESWAPPEGVGRVTIFADNDVSAQGQKSAWALCYRLRREGFEVAVALPDGEGQDWNDVLMDQIRQDKAA